MFKRNIKETFLNNVLIHILQGYLESIHYSCAYFVSIYWICVDALVLMLFKRM